MEEDSNVKGLEDIKVHLERRVVRMRKLRRRKFFSFPFDENVGRCSYAPTFRQPCRLRWR